MLQVLAVKHSLNGRELARVKVAEPEAFNFADGFDGNLAMDSLGRLYVTAGRAGNIIRVNREGRSEIFFPVWSIQLVLHLAWTVLCLSLKLDARVSFVLLHSTKQTAQLQPQP